MLENKNPNSSSNKNPFVDGGPTAEESGISLVKPDDQPGAYQPDPSEPHYNMPNLTIPGQPVTPGRYDKKTLDIPGQLEAPQAHQLHLPASLLLERGETAPGAYQPDPAQPHYNPYNAPNLVPLEPQPDQLKDLIVAQTGHNHSDQTA